MARSSARQIRLEDFEREIRLRPLAIEDYDELVAMQALCFPGMQTWGRDQIQSQIEVFPEGQIVVEYDDRIVASACSLIVDFDDYSEWHNWREIADEGYIRNHDPEGDTLYGIEIMVHPDYRGLKLARRLYAARREIARRFNLARIIVGGRIPGYHRHADEMSAREYAEKVVERGLYDPVLTTQTANGFVLKQLIPNYFPSDSDSRGYATFLEWTNLDYVPDPHRRFQRVRNVRLCTIQYQMRTVDNFDEFATQCRFFIDAASDYKADFVLFPELLTTQMLSFLNAHRPQDAARRLAELTPRYLEFFTEMAITYDVNIIGGSQFAVENDELHNVAYLFRRDGTIERQYKIHITPSERRWWGVLPGNELKVIDTDRGRIAILICYDIEFPELARIAAAQGAHILFVPFNTNDRDGYLRIRTCAQARCIENHQYVVVSGCVGNLPFVDNADVHYALVVQDVDVELLRRHRLRGTVQNWNDRRRDLYRIAYRKPDGSESDA
jgi:predicted amidohydrolase/ribosomal protein S18 acetylase RimI-like enzyme